jgi:hypothetical protein
MITRLLLILALVTCAADPGAAQQQRVPGSRARLTPPPGFVPATLFAGFQHEADEAGIMVMEMPGAPYAELTRGMTREGLASQRMELLDSTAVRVNGAEGLWLHAVQDNYGVPVHKQILITADERSAFMAVASMLGAQSAKQAEQLRASLMTLDWTEEPVTDVFEGLPFRVDVPPLLRGRQRLGGMLSLSEFDDTTPNAPGEAFVVVGVENGMIESGDVERRVTDRARRTATLTAFSGLEFRETTVAGRPAYEVTGSAVHEASGTPVRLYQVIIPMAFSYYIIQGMVGADRQAEFERAFRSVSGSFREVTSPETEE